MSEARIENAARWLQPADGMRDRTSSTSYRYHSEVSSATLRVETTFSRLAPPSLDRKECSCQLQRVSFPVKRTLASTSAAISCISAVKS